MMYSVIQEVLQEPHTAPVRSAVSESHPPKVTDGASDSLGLPVEDNIPGVTI